MTDPELIPTRADLKERIEIAWAELDRAVSALDEHQLTVEPVDGGWSINDHLAHLAVWIRSAAAIVAGESRPNAMKVDPMVWETGDEDKINAAIEAHWKGQPAEAVFAALQSAQTWLRDSIAGMSDEDLAFPYSHFQPGSPPFNHNPVAGWIAGNTFGHVDLHLPAILEIRGQVT